jgi:hypothetical protein
MLLFASSPAGSYRVFTGPAWEAGGGRVPEKVSHGLVGDVPKRVVSFFFFFSGRDVPERGYWFFPRALEGPVFHLYAVGQKAKCGVVSEK